MAPTVWYHVRDLETARRFYRKTLLFGELLYDPEENWVTTERGGMEIGLAEGEPTKDGVAHVFDPDGNRLQFAQELRS